MISKHRYVGYALLLIALLTLLVWAVSQFIQPILPSDTNSGLVLFFVALIAVIGGLAGFKDIIELFHLLGKQSDRAGTTSSDLGEREPPLSRRRNVDTGRTTQPVICPLPDNSQLLERLHITRERVVARVHEKCGLVLSSDVRAMFQELNARRMSRGLIPYYSGPRFKLAIPPRISDATLELDLIPLDYAYVALMKDEDTDATTKQMIQEKITRAAERLPASLQTEHPQINARSYSILGVMVCLITSDRLTLLRLRGRSVLTGRGQWDISVSGHPTTEDFGNGQLDLASTIRRETENEIGSIRGDPRRIVFTGLHRNKVSEDIDLLAFWPIDDSAEQVKQLITKKHTDQTTRIFKTTERARESYVWDTDNLLVEFDGSVILQALREKGVTLNVFVPEALVCLELALMARSCTTLSFSSS